MSWVITPTYQRDPDAEAYIAAVEAADEAASPGIGALEPAVRLAIIRFVLGCKENGFWPAIKASCILAGARTLTGALVPLVGAAPTNNNFVSGDYNRETGLVGDGSTKYLDSNRNNNSDPQDNHHLSVFCSTAETSGNFGIYIGAGDIGVGASQLGRASSPATDQLFRSRLNASTDAAPSLASNQGGATGFIGLSRSSSASFQGRVAAASSTYARASQQPGAEDIFVFKRATAGITTARLAFYSIGESLDLTLLDARVTTLINAFAAAIP
jgi:hypothetical protein